MNKRPLGRTGIEIAPLVLGGNVFGWTVDEPTAFTLLDRFLDAGLNAIDTADSYSMWVPGNQGGESESIIGKWLKKSPARREQTIIMTKVGSPLGPDRKGLSANRVAAAAEDSLRRLQTDRIDVYFTHFPDPATPIEETLGAYARLIEQGKVRAIGASNHDAAQLGDALRLAAARGLPRYEVVQPEYNLYDRRSYEGELRDLCISERLGVVTYYGLASGFLSGKYRSEEDLIKSVRGKRLRGYLDDRGIRILQALDDVAATHGVQPAEVALAWLMHREGVTAPIASATSISQLENLIRSTRLALSATDMQTLSTAGD